MRGRVNVADRASPSPSLLTMLPLFVPYVLDSSPCSVSGIINSSETAVTMTVAG